MTLSENAPWFVFAGGGTGGHLFPALAVIESLRLRAEPMDISVFCTGKPIDSQILEQAGVEAVPQSVQPFPRRPWHVPGFLRCWRGSVSACRKAFAARRPAVVVGAGGYASGPPVHTAIRMGIPTFLLNPDAIPGRANKHLANKGKLSGIFAQWPVSKKYFPNSAPVMVTGCPVRQAFWSCSGGETQTNKKTALGAFDLNPHQPVLLVTGASQGARTINEALIHLAGELASSGWQILHLSGAADQEPLQQAYAAAGVSAVVLPFTERMAEAMAIADLIVSRAGASSLAEILAAGKPSILLPYPFHRDRHQEHNAAVLVEAGAAVMLEDSKDGPTNARRLSSALKSLMTDEVRRQEMARAARNLARPDAAERIADRLCEAASG